MGFESALGEGGKKWVTGVKEILEKFKTAGEEGLSMLAPLVAFCTAKEIRTKDVLMKVKAAPGVLMMEDDKMPWKLADMEGEQAAAVLDMLLLPMVALGWRQEGSAPQGPMARRLRGLVAK